MVTMANKLTTTWNDSYKPKQSNLTPIEYHLNIIPIELVSPLKPISIKPKTKVNQGASNPLYKIYIILDQKNKGGEKILDSFSGKKI